MRQMRQWRVAMLLRFYPRAWRLRYGEEYRALLELHPLTARDALDSVCGAWDAHLRGYRDGTEIAPLPRTAVFAIFGAWLAFVVAGMEVYSIVDDSVFVPAMRAHPAFALAWQALAGGAILSFAAVVAGGAVINIGVVQYAQRHRRGLLRLFIVPALTAVLCAAYTFGALAVSYRWITPPAWTQSESALQVNFFVGYTMLVLFAGSTLASGAAMVVLVVQGGAGIVRVRMGRITRTVEAYRLARLLAHVLALALWCATLAMLGWDVLAGQIMPYSFTTHRAELLTVTATMAMAAGFVTALARRGDAPHPAAA